MEDFEKVGKACAHPHPKMRITDTHLYVQDLLYAGQPRPDGGNGVYRRIMRPRCSMTVSLGMPRQTQTCKTRPSKKRLEARGGEFVVAGDGLGFIDPRILLNVHWRGARDTVADGRAQGSIDCHLLWQATAGRRVTNASSVVRITQG